MLIKKIRITTPSGEQRILEYANKDYYMALPGYEVEVIEVEGKVPETMPETERKLREEIIRLNKVIAQLQAENKSLKDEIEALKENQVTAKKRTINKK